MQPLLCTGNTRVVYFGVGGAISSTLPGSFFDVEGGFPEVIDELVSTIKDMPDDKQSRVLTLVKQKLATSAFDNDRCITNPIHEWLLPPNDIQRLPRRIAATQRVEQRVAQPAPQRVSPTPLTDTIPIPRITTAPPIMLAPNPTAKRTLKTTLRTHQQHT